MASFIRKGNSWEVVKDGDINLHGDLAVGNYSISTNSKTLELFLSKVDSFDVPKKIYGKTFAQSQRILNTFLDRKASTGVLLSGEKGSGKTLLAKLVSYEAAKLGIPTILIGEEFDPIKLNSFIQGIDQKCVVLMDEFEKVFDKEHQEGMLTLLDGTFPSKMLFILTCNDVNKIDCHMVNRPGRIFYALDFSSISEEEIVEYCKDVLIDQSQIKEICRIAKFMKKFNFDQLKAMVEEMNRYNENALSTLNMLNISPDDSNLKYNVEIIHKGKKAFNVYPDSVSENPLNIDSIEFDFRLTKSGNLSESIEVNKNNLNISKIDSNRGIFVYEKDKTVVTLTLQPEINMDYKEIMKRELLA